MATEQRTSPEMRAAARERARLRDEKGFEYTAVEVGTVTALCDDADALAGARAAIIPALDQIGTCAGWLAESGPGDEQTSIARLGIDQAVKAIRAALTPGTGGAGA